MLMMVITRLRRNVVKLRRNYDPVDENRSQQVESSELVFH